MALSNTARKGRTNSDLGKRIAAVVAALLAAYLGIALLLGWYWSRSPDPFDVRAAAQLRLGQEELPSGAVTTSTLAIVAETLLRKPGGYTSNDILPPGLLMDNMPSWEYGALVQIRDLARSLRNDMSRSRSQSLEDPDLAEAEPRFNYRSDAWIFPSTESQYKIGVSYLNRYLQRLTAPNRTETPFYPRADNLEDWLNVVNQRLGSLSQRLSASVGQYRVNMDQDGRGEGNEVFAKTPRLKVDNVFYEARGATWALLHFLKAVEIDYESVLRDKNAQASLRQVIRELEAAQRAIRSPIVLNGSGYGIFANHSLTMGSYIARANAALIDLRNILRQG